EGFETWPPAGWGIYDNGIGLVQTWKQSNALASQPAHTGTYAAFVDRENVPTGSVAADWLITPAINVPTNAQLKFWSRLTIGGDQGGRYYVKMLVINGPEDTQSDLGNSGWVNIVPTGTGYWTESQINPQFDSYTEKVIPITAPVGAQVYIAFVMEADFMDRWLIDDVQLSTLCPVPVPAAATNISQNGATLSWPNTNAVKWEVVTALQSAAPVFSNAVTVLTNSYTPTNLLPGTCYKYYVRAFCTADNPSDWSAPVNFCTVTPGATCAAALPIPTDNYSTTDNTSNYGDDFDGTPGTGCGTTATYLNGDEVVYAYTPTYTGVASISMTNNGPVSGMFVYGSCAAVGVNCIAGGIGSATTPVNIPALSVTAGTTYYIVISSSTQQSTPYTLTIQRVNCAPPTAAQALNVNESSATLQWNANAATSWQIVVQNAGGGLPTGAGTTVTTSTGNVVTATTAGVPFESSTAYEYYVRADCGAGDGTFSAWTGPIPFSTTQVAATLNYTQDFEAANSGFTFNNGTQVNKWAVGNATSNGGTRSLYISENNGTTNTFNVTSLSVVQAYRDIQMPAVVDQVSLSFDWKAQGESCCDYLRVWLVPATFTPVAGTQIAPGAGRIQVGGNYNVNGTWTTVNQVINANQYAGQVVRLVFEWRNDGSIGTQPPAAVDNINLSAITCSAPSALTLTPVTGNNATFSWTAPASGAESYDYYVSTTSVAPTASTTPTGNETGTTKTISSLLPSTNYNIWVRSNCGPDGVSFWIGPVSFNTPQVPATMNYSQDFENPATIGFTLNNGTQPNKWVVGNATSNGGTSSLYISDNNGTTNTFNVSSTSVVQAYRDIQMPAVLDQMTLSFDWKAQGESCCDYLRVWIVPISFTPTAGTQIVAGAGRTQVGGNYNVNGTWTTVNSVINATQY
ncbi:MAG: fibronectin type III domain-containing protein, partial [Sphingobacteriales bacterium]